MTTASRKEKKMVAPQYIHTGSLVGSFQFFFPLTNVVLLQQAVEGWQVLHNELAENPLVRLDAQQGGREVGRGEQVFDQSAHHPEHVLLLQEEEETGNHLGTRVWRKVSESKRKE